MTNHCCKIGRTIAKYNLQESVIGGDLNENLRARWVGENEFPETATRPLTDWFNQKILKKVYNEHDRKAIETQLESDYEALRSDDEIKRGAIIDDLADDGIDGEELLDDFAKRSTMYRHLTQCLDAEKSKGKSDSDSNWEEDKIEYAKNTMEKNVEDVLRSLERKGELPNGTEAEIQTPIILSCHVDECSTQTRFNRARKRGYICSEHSDTDEEIQQERTDGADSKNESNQEPQSKATTNSS
jgi:hypothetical protein